MLVESRELSFHPASPQTFSAGETVFPTRDSNQNLENKDVNANVDVYKEVDKPRVFNL